MSQLFQKPLRFNIGIIRKILEQRLALWHAELLDDLIDEANTLQMRKKRQANTTSLLSTSLKTLHNDHNTKVLHVNDIVNDVPVIEHLKRLHPEKQDLNNFILQESLKDAVPHHSILLASLRAEHIIDALMKTNGAAALRASRTVLRIPYQSINVLVHHQKYDIAKIVFQPDPVQISTDGVKVLGSLIGEEQYCCKDIDEKITNWCKTIRKLQDIASLNPKVAYYAYTKAMKSKWTYYLRTYKVTTQSLAKLDAEVKSFTEVSLEFGGMDIRIPLHIADSEHMKSKLLADSYLNTSGTLFDIRIEQEKIIGILRQEKDRENVLNKADMMERSDDHI
ncbi:hypothetical protein GJ496_001735 [Pomphorhynchus laevis]|nr:hypothetical protein GJ496_001735 [Pomphorhynchus laevis]